MSLWHLRASAMAAGATNGATNNNPAKPKPAAAVDFDPLRVPRGVRERLADALPAREFLLFRGNARTGLTCAVTNAGEHPYHICLPRWTPFWKSRVAAVATMAAGRATAYARLSELVSRQNPAVADLPILREVWEDKPHTLVAYDMMFPAGYEPSPADTRNGTVTVNAFIFTIGKPDPINVILHARVRMF